MSLHVHVADLRLSSFALTSLAAFLLAAPAHAEDPVSGFTFREGAELGARPVEHHQGSQIIYVNFDGGSLQSGSSDNAPAGVTRSPEAAGMWPAFGAGAKRDAVWQAVKIQWAPFGVELTDAQPTASEYTLCMVGDKSRSTPPEQLGLAPVDCNNANPNNVAMAFHHQGDEWDATVAATTISQEVAHTFGLEHTHNEDDIMFSVNRLGRFPTFPDTCAAVDRYAGFDCPGQRASACPAGDQQNAYQELLNMFGEGDPDMDPPVVTITEPANGAEILPGVQFRVAVDATDVTGVDQVRLSIGEQGLAYEEYTLIGTGVQPPYEWNSVLINEPGVYNLAAEASDPFDQTTIAEVTIYVGVEAPPTTGGVGGTEGEAGTGGISGSGRPTTGIDDDGSRDGCGCAGTPTSGWAFALVPFAALVGRRRRR